MLPFRKHFLRVAGPLVIALTLLLLTACGAYDAPQTTLDPKGSSSRIILDLYKVIGVMAAIVFVVVEGLLVYSVVRFRRRPDDGIPLQIHGNQPIEIVWTIIPLAVLIVAFGATVIAIHDINTPGKGTIMNVTVVGHQWWWEFQYPVQPGISRPISTANEIHIPAGQNVHFHITSHDVIHSFWIPQVQRQVDANPGEDNAVYTKVDQPGTYDGMCYEYCGDAHAWMKARMIVQSPAQFYAWTRAQEQSATSPSSALALQGQKVFSSNTCINCHTLSYTGSHASGIVGPNLTHLASRWTIGAGAAPMDKQDLAAWIRNPSDYKPGTLMPDYPALSKKDLSALVAYLINLK